MVNVVVCSSEPIIHEQFMEKSNLYNFQVIKHLTFRPIEILKIESIKVENVVDLSNLNKKLLDGKLEDMLYYKNIDFIQSNQFFESIIFHMMNRIDIHKDLKYLERRNIYYKLIAYWIKFFNENDVDLVFFSGIPHEVSDYGAYLTSKYLGINTLILTPVYQFNRVMINKDFKSPYFNEKFKKLYDELNSSESINFESIFENHLNFENSIQVPDTLSKFQMENKKFATGFKKISLFRSLRQIFIKNGLTDDSIISGYREILVNRSFLVTILKYLKYFISYTQINLEVKSLNLSYTKFAQKEFDLNFEYVLYYLHYEPENSTTPMGGFFGNQELVISAIALNLPKNWKLIVKEHPFQISNISGYSYLGRETGFYNRIANIPNVVLLRHSVHSFEILQNAKAVATITGSIGWEAHVLGKPVLIFGDVWYEGLTNMYRVSESKEIARILSNIHEDIFDESVDNLRIQELKTTIRDIHRNSFSFNYSKQECSSLGLIWDENEIRIKTDKIIDFIIENHQSVFTQGSAPEGI